MTVGNEDVVPNTVDTQFCNKSPFLYSLVRKTTLPVLELWLDLTTIPKLLG